MLIPVSAVPFRRQTGTSCLRVKFGSSASGPSTTDRLKNLQAAGSATIVTGASRYGVQRFEVVPTGQVEGYFPEKEQQQHGRFGVREAIRLRRAELDYHSADSTAAAGMPTATFGGR
jgi:hypothetical protein